MKEFGLVIGLAILFILVIIAVIWSLPLVAVISVAYLVYRALAWLI